jgi:hypothetical protein
MSSGSNPQTEDRIKLLKSGFKAYVNPIKLPISAETKWMLEIVCINDKPAFVEPQNIYQQANNYLVDQLYQTQDNITKNKQDWINLMKNS